jgi:uncharacterized protein YutE (UPF0331/DUF86 family)
VLEIPQGLSRRGAQRRTSPRTCFRSAFKHEVIDNDPFWIDLTVLRNYIVHTYNEQLADYVYSRLGEATRRFRVVLAATAIEGD